MSELFLLASKLFLFVYQDVLKRIDRAQHALACDDHACDHYGETPCPWFRARLATKHFIAKR